MPLPERLAHFLEGFEIVPSDGAPFITLDKQRRFYLNASARKLLGVEPYDRVILAYSPSEKAVAIVKHDYAHMESDGLFATSVFVVDKRYYLSARKFAKEYAFEPEGAPYYFDYVRGEKGGVAFAFKLRHD